jgi:hypothetical protein
VRQGRRGGQRIAIPDWAASFEHGRLDDGETEGGVGVYVHAQALSVGCFQINLMKGRPDLMGAGFAGTICRGAMSQGIFVGSFAMSESQAAKFDCSGCGRKYPWKEQLAGKKAKCKCGHLIEVPRTAPEAEGDIYDIAEEESPPPRKVVKPVVALAGAPALAVAGTAAASAGTLAYQRGPTQREKDRFSQTNLMHMPHDVYVPVGLLIAGMLLYAAYFSTAYHLSSHAAGIAFVGVGMLTAFKTVLLIVFALMIAGPAGVSFGGLWTAILKLAAVAVFCDGVASWVDYAVQRASGAPRMSGPFGFGIIGFPVALLIYWTLYVYLFGMDWHESWIVIRFLSIFDRLVRWGLFFLLLSWFVHGIPVVGSRAPAVANTAAASSDPLSAHVQDLKDTDSLIEARKYIADGHQAVLSKPVDDWYAAGCTNVWFEIGHADINGRSNALGVIVELPADKPSRAKCLDVLKAYYDGIQIPCDPAEMKDSGQAYLQVMMR